MSGKTPLGETNSPDACRACGGTGYVRMAPTEDYEKCVLCVGGSSSLRDAAERFPDCPYCENGLQQIGPEPGMVEPCHCPTGGYVQQVAERGAEA